MSDVRISRRRFVAAGALGTVGVLLAPEAVLARNSDDQPELVRWDLIQIRDGVVLAGGIDVSTDAHTGDMVSLTGSGEARPEKQQATGGGTFVHQHNATLVASGVYYVTGLKSFVNGGGSLAGSGLVDSIDAIKRTDGGILTMDVHAIVDAPPALKGATVDGVLEVDCALGTATTREGVRLKVLSFDFKPDPSKHGFTLFHVLDD